jgi:TPR repeat protein
MTDIDTLKKAAIIGDTKAQNRLGDCYAFGRGVPLDYDEALKWFRRAAEQGDEVAKINVRYAENMKAVPAEKAREEEQFKELEKAAAKGDADAQYKLVDCYIFGRYGRHFDIPPTRRTGCSQDREKAMEWCHKAAKQGHLEAQYRLGCFYAEPSDWRDREKSAKWFRKAAEQGHVEAQFHLGIYYHHYAGFNSFLRSFLSPIGFLAKSDRNEAVKWFRKVAEQGHVEALYELGCCYEESADSYNPSFANSLAKRQADELAKTRDEAEAANWYRKAAEHGHAKAQYRLGCRYRDGRGVAKNLFEAYKWLNLAWEKWKEEGRSRELRWDEKSAGEDRDKLAALMTPDQIAEAHRLAREFQPHKEVSPTH